MQETIFIRGVEFWPICQGKPSHAQGLRKLVKLVRVSDGKVIFGK
mgnify:CR=1 FL=1